VAYRTRIPPYLDPVGEASSWEPPAEPPAYQTDSPEKQLLPVETTWHVRACVRACTRRLTCPLLPNANAGSTNALQPTIYNGGKVGSASRTFSPDEGRAGAYAKWHLRSSASSSDGIRKELTRKGRSGATEIERGEMSSATQGWKQGSTMYQ
jgi:hypothetical protein